MRSTKRLPHGLSVPKLVLRHITGWRTPCSAALLVGSTPSTSTKVQSAGSNVDLAASSRDALRGARHSGAQVHDDVLPQGRHEFLESQPRHRAVADTVPRVEHRLGEQFQRLTDCVRLGTVGLKASELAKQMRPAELPTRHVHPGVRAPGIRNGDSGEGRSEQLLGHLGPPARADEEDRQMSGDGGPGQARLLPSNQPVSSACTSAPRAPRARPLRPAPLRPCSSPAPCWRRSPAEWARRRSPRPAPRSRACSSGRRHCTRPQWPGGAARSCRTVPPAAALPVWKCSTSGSRAHGAGTPPRWPRPSGLRSPDGSRVGSSPSRGPPQRRHESGLIASVRDLLRRHHCTRLLVMTGLPATPSAGSLGRRGRWRAGGIGRGRARRIAGELGQPGFQFPDALLQRSNRRSLHAPIASQLLDTVVSPIPSHDRRTVGVHAGDASKLAGPAGQYRYPSRERLQPFKG